MSNLSKGDDMTKKVVHLLTNGTRKIWLCKIPVFLETLSQY